MNNEKEYSKEYMQYVEKQLHEVMFEKPCKRDWYQMCLSLRDVMIAASTIFGSETDEQKDNLSRLLTELVIRHVLPNLTEWNITCRKKVKDK